MNIFIGYTREDFQSASRLCRDLKKAGLNPWLDNQDTLPGENWKKIIENRLEQCRFYIPRFSTKFNIVSNQVVRTKV